MGLLWYAVIIAGMLVFGYTQLGDESKSSVNMELAQAKDKVLDKLLDDPEDNQTIVDSETNSSYNPEKIELGKITTEVETDCIIDSQCQSFYEEESVCEEGTCFKLQ